MNQIRNLSIRIKMAVLVMVIVAVSLALAATAILINDVMTAREMLAADNSALAKLLASNSVAALRIADVAGPAAAEDVLQDLIVQRNVTFASLHDQTGQQVARYVAEGQADVTPILEHLGATFTNDGYLDVVQQVELDDNTVIGKVFLRTSAQDMRNKIRRDIGIVATIFVLSLVFAGLLLIALQRIVVTPILALAAAAESVSVDHDYSIRVTKVSNDELGTLSDGFNSMLAEIQARDDELQQHRAGLAELVKERTQDLESRTADLARSNAELQRKNSDLDEFAYIASHDLRSPLRGIDNLARWVLKNDGDALSDQSRDDLTKLRERVARMNGLLEGLLQYSRVGRKQYESEDLETTEMARQLADLLHQPKEFTVEVSDDMPRITTQRVPLEQVLRNLIDNAIKHHDRPDGKVNVTAKDCGKLVEFSVSDDGPGISKEYHDRVFRIFETIKTRDEIEGSGMGLALVQKIVETHGGSISLQSEVGKGTTFTFTWPKS